MTSMQEALTDALAHPLEYHPQHPPQLRKRKPTEYPKLRDMAVLGLGIASALAGAAMLARRRTSLTLSDDVTAGI
jgi:hypothetical protein